MDDRCHRNAGQGFVDHLPEMVFFRHLHRHGMGLPRRFRTIMEHAAPQRFSLAVGRRYYLHGGRCHLCFKAAAL